MKTRDANFFELYREAVEENIEEVDRALEEAGIDAVKSLEQTMQLIKREKAKSRLEEGEKRKGTWKEVQNRVSIASVNDSQVYYAYRKHQGLSEEDKEELKTDINLLNELDKRDKG